MPYLPVNGPQPPAEIHQREKEEWGGAATYVITSRQVAADPDHVHAASDAYKAVLVQSRVHIPPTTSAANCDLAFACIDRNTVEIAEVNDDTVLSTAGATGVVTAALHS